MIDPKDLTVPNVNFSIYTEGDRREEQFKKERLTRGFDESETWSLRDTIANFIIPRLEEYIEIEKTQGGLHIEKLNTFLESMRLTARDSGSFILTAEETKIHKEGLSLFPEIFMGMWW